MLKAQKKIRYRGAAVVEAAIVFPLLLILTFGVIEYGWLFLKAQQIANAARNGARVAIRADSTVEEVQAVVANLMAAANIGYDPDNDLTISDIEPGVGLPVTVSISIASQDVAIMNVPFFPLPPDIGASVTMSKEGP